MKKNKKTYISIFAVVVLLIAVTILVTNGKTLFKNTKDTMEENVYKIRVKADIAMPESIYDASKYVALVKIESIDGYDNYSKINNSYVFPYTYGKMKILKVIKGDLEENSVVKYYRMGGKLPASKYYEGENEVNHKISNPDMIIDSAFEDDISVEVGKTYLSYLVDETTREGKENTYGMYGFQYGLREVKNQSSKVNYINSIKSDIEVLDNTTGKYEKLSKVISERR